MAIARSPNLTGLENIFIYHNAIGERGAEALEAMACRVTM